MAIKLIMTLQEVLDATTLSHGVWHGLVAQGKAPKPRELSKGRVGWRVRDIEEFVENLPESKALPPVNAGQYDRAAAKARRAAAASATEAGAQA